MLIPLAQRKGVVLFVSSFTTRYIKRTVRWLVSGLILPLTAGPLPLHNSQFFTGSLQRENSSPFSITMDTTLKYTAPVPRKIPYDLPHLPVITNKVVFHWTTKKNCVTTVRRAGYYVPQTRDGFARTMPVTTNLPPQGKLFVMATRESTMGHVIVGKLVGNTIVSVVDSEGVGRKIPLSLYRGYVKAGG